MENSESFYVCFYKDKDGNRIGHAASPKNDFPEKVPTTIDLHQTEITPISELFNNFCKSMLGYIDMLPAIAAMGSVISKGIRESKLTGFCQSKARRQQIEKERDIYELDLSKYTEFRSIDLRADAAQFIGKQVPKMLLIGIVSGLDHHISQLVRYIINKYPNMVFDADKSVSIKDIFRSNSLGEFKEYMIDREVEDISRKSFGDQIKWIEKRSGINKDISKEYSSWQSLIEIIERRNLFAHADGIVNDLYIKNIPYDTDSPARIDRGVELFASAKYFEASIHNICEFGVKLTQVVWRKLEPSESRMADDALGDFGFTLIERGEYKLAASILEFAVNEIQGGREEGRRRIDIVNLSNTYKLDGRLKECEAVLLKEDWSFVSDNFAISVVAIREDISNVIKYMRRLASSGETDGKELEEWPVFFHVRDDDRFKEEFTTLFRRSYVPAPKDRHRIFANALSNVRKKQRKVLEQVDDATTRVAIEERKKS